MKNKRNNKSLKGLLLDFDTNELLVGGRTFHLKPKEIEVLELLVDNVDRTVQRKDILRTVWHDSYGNDSGITQAISSLRAIFNLVGYHDQLIRTIPKKGYQLVSSHLPKRKQDTMLMNLVSNHRTITISIGLIALAGRIVFFSG